MQVTPKIVQVGTAANMFILTPDEGRLAVIDTGMPGGQRTILKQIEAMGYAPTAITDILITHADIDHVGGLAKLAETTGAAIHAAEKSTPYIQQAKAPPHIPALFALVMGPMQSLIQKKARVDHSYTDGQAIPVGGGITVIDAPGHTPDNVCLWWEAEGVLFAADLLFSMGGRLSLTPTPISWDVDLARASARKVLALDPAIICTGHGPPIITADQPAQVEAFRQSL